MSFPVGGKGRCKVPMRMGCRGEGSRRGGLGPGTEELGGGERRPGVASVLQNEVPHIWFISPGKGQRVS